MSISRRDIPADPGSPTEGTERTARGANGEPPAVPMRDEAPDLDPEDRRLFGVLDMYLEALHRGDEGSQSSLSADNREMLDLLACLHSLDSLAPAADEIPPATDPDADLIGGDSGGGDSGGDPVSDPTIIWPGDAPPVLPAPPALSGSAANTGTGPRRSIDQFPDGEPFGKYRLLEERGRGGMGVVFRAWESELERCVALKMILQSRLASDDDVRRFYNEARSAAKLRHPNIVGIHEVGEIAGQPYFSMDYVGGPCLNEVLADGPLELNRAASLVATVARAVHYLHEHGVVHRDLKPSNILIDEDGQPFVTDFGLVKLLTDCPDGDRTRTGAIVGTASYMAPEQAAARSKDISPRSDVYSLGAILYELLSGRPPFRRDNPLDTLVDVLEGEPTLLCRLRPDVPRELEIICFKCLEKDPAHRYASAAELADDLERFLRGDAIEAQASGMLAKLKRWARREPGLVSRLAALSISGLVVQINYWITYEEYIETASHWRIMGILAVWAAASCTFQRLLSRDAWAYLARFAWSATDIVLVTAVFYEATGPIGPVVIAYPALVVSSGLFFRVRLVIFTTLMSLVAYIALTALRPDSGPQSPHYNVLFAAALVVTGAMVAYQVYRVRVLSRHFEGRM
jgi:serine/threonine-protein kinase